MGEGSAGLAGKPAHKQGVRAARLGLLVQAIFSFLFFKKNQKFKNICPFRKISKIYPGRPWVGRQDLNVPFFFKFAKRSLAGGAWGQGGPVAPPLGRLGGPSTGDTGDLSPPPSGDRLCPLYKPLTPILSSFEPKNSTKNLEKKKRGMRTRGAAKPCRIAYLWSAGNYIWIHWYCIAI